MGFVKDQVYRTTVCNLADLQERIYAAVNNVTPQMLHNTWVEVDYQLDISRATMEAMLRFMEHKAKKKSQFSLFVSIGFIYRLVLVRKLKWNTEYLNVPISLFSFFLRLLFTLVQYRTYIHPPGLSTQIPVGQMPVVGATIYIPYH